MRNSPKAQGLCVAAAFRRYPMGRQPSITGRSAPDEGVRREECTAKHAEYTLGMVEDRPRRALDALRDFVETPIERMIGADAAAHAFDRALALFRDVAVKVPAYRELLAAEGVNPAEVRDRRGFESLPLLTKDNYVRRFPLPSRCREGDLSTCDFVCVSSGSTGDPTLWPRFVSDELAVATRFEQVLHDSFDADRRRTLAVVCFPLGTWVGGMFTTSCLRHVAAKGYPLVTVTPGNQKAEILRVVGALAPMFEQTVLFGYPPFLKDVIDGGIADGLRWGELNLRLVLAGEVISEEWRALMAERTGVTQPLHDTASLYGTADAGVLGTETPLSICIRRFLAERPDAARAIFGEPRLPTLVQYDPRSRWFEKPGDTLVFTADGGVPLVRYDLGDTGGIVAYDEMLDRVRALGLDAVAEVRRDGGRGARRLPFAYVFGRGHFAVSYYGANVFPDTVAIALEQPTTREWVTGKFVMEVKEDARRDPHLHVAVELEPGAAAEDEPRLELLAGEIAKVLLRLNSEYAHYVPPDRQRPIVTLWPAGHPKYFPVGVKHRYSRK